MRVLILALLLSACAHKVDTGLVKPVQLPELPSNLSEKAKALPKITGASMGSLVVDGTNADMQYNAVSIQLNNLIDLYNCIKVSVNEKKDINLCLQ